MSVVVGAVEWIDQPARRCAPLVAATLLGDDVDVGEIAAQGSDDQRLAGAIDVSHHFVGALQLGLGATSEPFDEQRASLASEIDDLWDHTPFL